MALIVLSPEQTRLLASASFPIVIMDARGQKVAELSEPSAASPMTNEMTEEEWVAEAVRRKQRFEREGGLVYTTAEVLEHCRSLKPE
jgi:hypothetical protein